MNEAQQTATLATMTDRELTKLIKRLVEQVAVLKADIAYYEKMKMRRTRLITHATGERLGRRGAQRQERERSRSFRGIAKTTASIRRS